MSLNPLCLDRAVSLQILALSLENEKTGIRRRDNAAHHFVHTRNGCTIVRTDL